MGTVFYVKTMIRERKNPKFWYFSLAYHLIILLINHKFYLFFSLILLTDLLLDSFDLFFDNRLLEVLLNI